MTTDVDGFLEHYGKKGMKWGVTSAKPSAQVKAARKKARSQYRDEIDADFTKKNVMRGKYNPDGVAPKVALGKAALNMATLGGYQAAQISRSAGYSKGQSAAIGYLAGPIGGFVAAELAVRRRANEIN